MIIREYCESDERELRRLIAAFADEFREILPPEKMRFEELADDGVETWFKIDTQEQHVIVADTGDEKLAGFASGKVDEQREMKLKRWGNVDSVFVEKGHRRQGLATAFVEELRKWFIDQGCQGMFVETWFEDTAAIDAYRSMGFTDLSIGFVKML